MANVVALTLWCGVLILGEASSFTVPRHYQEDRFTLFSQSVDSGEETRKGQNPLLSLNLNLDSLAKSNQPGAAPRAQELLQRIEVLHKKGYYALPPDVVSLNSVLNAWANSDEPDAPQKALMLLKQEIEKKSEMDIITFNTVLMAFAKRGLVVEGSEVLNLMKEHNFTADTITYNSLLYAHSQAKQPQEAENLLREMIKLKMKPDVVSFNTVMLAWANSRNKDAAKNVEELFQHMENLYQAGNRHVAPDIYSCTTVLQALAKSRNAARAKSFIKFMEEASVDRPELTPNCVAVTSVLTALSKRPDSDSAPYAEQLLEKLNERFLGGNQDCKPDAVLYTAFIGCITRSGAPNAGDRALEVLHQMKADADAGESEMTPNALTYTNVMKAVVDSAQNDASDVALELLEELENSYSDGNVASRPATPHYNIALDGIAKSEYPDKAQQADKLLRHMLSQNNEQARPTINTFDAVLRACSGTNGNPKARESALRISFQVFELIIKSSQVEPSSVTFASLIKSMKRMMRKKDPNRVKLISKAFRKCCSLGLLNSFVLRQVQAALSDQELQLLLNDLNVRSDGRLSPKDMPSMWSENAT